MLPFLLRVLACWSLLGPALALAQQEAAPAEEEETLRTERKLTLLRLRLETWEITALDAARWLDEAKDSAGLAELRTGFLTGQKAASLIASPTLSIEEGARHSAESILESVYPVEYAGSELPDPAKPPPSSAEEAFARRWRDSILGRFLYPDTLEVRNVGDSLEAQVRRVAGTPGSWDLSLSFDRVETPGNLEFGGGSLVKMPLFSSSSRRASGILLKEGRWRLLSVMETPPGVDGKATARRWLTLVRLDPEP